MPNNADLEFPNYDGHKPSLHEIDPLPIEDPEKASISSDPTGEDVLPPPSHKPSAYSPLGLSSHSMTWYLTRIQRYSTYAFSAFAVMHITNTSLIPLVTRSVPASEPYLLLTRPYYQSPLAEPLIIALPLWAHVLSGLALRVHRRNLNVARYGDAKSLRRSKSTATTTSFWPAVSLTSRTGFLLTPLVVGHVLLNRTLPAVSGKGNVGLDYVAHHFARHSLVSYAGFTALVGIASWHVVWGWARWLGWLPEQVVDMGPKRETKKNTRWLAVHSASAAVALMWLAGSFGVVARGGLAPGWIGKEYDEMVQAIPVIGKWL